MDDDMRVQAGDVVRESGCDLRMTVVGLHLTDDGRTVAECRYPEEGHPDADGEGMRVGTFAVGMLRLVERPAALARELGGAVRDLAAPSALLGAAKTDPTAGEDYDRLVAEGRALRDSANHTATEAPKAPKPRRRTVKP